MIPSYLAHCIHMALFRPSEPVMRPFEYALLCQQMMEEANG